MQNKMKEEGGKISNLTLVLFSLNAWKLMTVFPSLLPEDPQRNGV